MKIKGLKNVSDKVVILYALFTILSLNLWAQTKDNNELNFVVLPYIQDVSESSVCVMWETSAETKGQIYLATTEHHVLKPDLNIAVTEKKPSLVHKLSVSHLKPDQLYFYQVINVTEKGDTLKGPVTQLRIPDYNQSDITFTAVGDNQGDTQCWEKISMQMFNECPQFVIHCGDFVSYGHHNDDWTDEFFKQAQSLIRHVPLYPVLGNHEMNDELYYQYFNRTLNNAFYSIKKGDLRLIFVDTNKDVLPGSEQYEELEKLLANTTEKWKILIHHHPIFTSDFGSYRSSLMSTADKGDPNTFHLKTLYETYGVDLVLSGHVHGYERTHPIAKNHIDTKNGVVYIITAGGGGSFNREASYKEWFTAKTRKIPHFLKVQIKENKMAVEAIDTFMNVFDTWKLEKQTVRNHLNAPLVSFSSKYFNDSTIVAIENTNNTGCINYRLDDGNYQTAFEPKIELTVKNTTTISAVVSEPDNTSSERVKTAVKLPLMAQKSGRKSVVKASYYEGFFTLLPDFEGLEPVRIFSLDSLAMSDIQPRRKDHFAVRFQGEIYIPETDVYRFLLKSFDGSLLLIDGQQIVKNDGVHYEIFKEGYAALEKGFHDFEVHYFDYINRETLNVKMGKQGKEMFDINHFLQVR
ncbi:metallophosphoesterase [Prolixibacteraceae bacterium Z1-6]|uniref:Metallophosphoesterase n=1 Tax=Draconibacterium aestuarii TaxID=2998507 RepID=A0A9X3F4J4_9BACT|nr:metallophosphoesterase [Prolixibacteraceae bacterium Z1-6]